MKEKKIKRMVDRFLMWRLPEDFNPDCGISFEREHSKEYMAKLGKPPMKYEPVGTNLFSAQQAEVMVRYMLGEDACDKHGKEDCMKCFYTTQPIEPPMPPQIKQAKLETLEAIIKEVEETKERFRCAACDSKISNHSHTHCCTALSDLLTKLQAEKDLSE